VSYQSGTTGGLSIVIVGEVTPRDSVGDLSDQQKGHAIDFIPTSMSDERSKGCQRRKGIISYELSQVYRFIRGYQLFVACLFSHYRS
jgi:hypothetical protein